MVTLITENLRTLNNQISSPEIGESLDMKKEANKIASLVILILNNPEQCHSLTVSDVKIQISTIRNTYEEKQKSRGLISRIAHSFYSIFGLGSYGIFDNIIKAINKATPKQVNNEPTYGGL